MPRIIHWFRRDLRLGDNAALTAAARASGGAVLPVFILDEAILFGRFASPGRTAWLLENLRTLDAALRARGLRLIVRRGDPLRELLALARESGAAGVYWNRDYTPYAIRRDTAVKQALRASGLAAHSFKDAVIFEMDEVQTDAGTPYSVYTPYARRWRQRLAAEGCRTYPPPDLIPGEPWPASLPIPALADLGLRYDLPLPPAGEAAALERLAAFADLRRQPGITSYAEQRNYPGIDGTSRLSPYLRLGVLGIRTALRAALDLEGAAALTPAARDSLESWIGELAWRDFYVQVLYHFPHALRGAFKREYDALEWENDPALLAAWQEGRTGYPIVDAAMRQLRQEGWMHNRARMIVASFLTKDLLVDWREGERHFMRLLLDGDPAANNGGWQWAAGTGTDAQPYFRIFNPVSQGQKFDPEGAYVRRYVPELAAVPVRYIHTPHLLPPAEQIRAGVRLGRDYPLPIVDHQTRRAMALNLYRKVKGKE
ncbi:MAG: deoxyribodipyrimidine photo-lyase [Oscillochloridaceae bacterium]|nr:DNA photolyase family protein [Chloroflexaceae bacterium]MDW8392240.1 deoxyribodipyrimidine photo-lyase [Oscillochloridaceae bacterium]